MKYKTPELIALACTINAVQTIAKGQMDVQDSPNLNWEESAAYADWAGTVTHWLAVLGLNMR